MDRFEVRNRFGAEVKTANDFLTAANWGFDYLEKFTVCKVVDGKDVIEWDSKDIDMEEVKEQLRRK